MSIERFIDAYNNGYNNYKSTFDIALKEIKKGKKKSCWMWYIFPQIDGLINNPSNMTKHFSIKSIEEAILFLNNEIVGEKLKEITRSVLNLKLNNNQITSKTIFEDDSLKLLSSMTLFSYIFKITNEKGINIFEEVINKYYTIDCISTKLILEKNKNKAFHKKSICNLLLNNRTVV